MTPASPSRPVLGASALVRNGDRVLLIQRGRAPDAGLWSLPGGRVEAGERLEDAAIREILEETGVAIDGLQQIDMVEIIRHDAAGTLTAHFVLVVFAGRYVSGTPRAGDDAAAAAWFRGDEMGRLDMTEHTRLLMTSRGFLR